MIAHFTRTLHSSSTRFSGLTLFAVLLVATFGRRPAAFAADGHAEIDTANGISYRVLQPIESGDLAIFPVVQTAAKPKAVDWQYITLDEGLKNGEVVVTEAGRAQGLVRPRHPGWIPAPGMGDQVNRLVLINNSKKPLLLLAGEIVTGGKQDRVIAKDRIVPSESEPVDLSVFCIEPGRWVENSVQFGAAGKGSMGFMVQPSIRNEAMAAQNQQRVWSAVGAALGSMEIAAAPPSQGGPMMGSSGSLHGTTSYAKAMQNDAVGRKVDHVGEPLLQSREQLLAKLREEHAVGVVVAVRGEIVWADIFANTDLLGKYWTKLIRSYAAEALTSNSRKQAAATQEEAQHFLDAAASGHETSEGESGVYRYREVRVGDTASFVLQSLLPGTGFDVHTSKVRTEPASAYMRRPIR